MKHQLHDWCRLECLFVLPRPEINDIMVVTLIPSCHILKYLLPHFGNAFVLIYATWILTVFDKGAAETSSHWDSKDFTWTCVCVSLLSLVLGSTVKFLNSFLMSCCPFCFFTSAPFQPGFVNSPPAPWTTFQEFRQIQNGLYLLAPIQPQNYLLPGLIKNDN